MHSGKFFLALIFISFAIGFVVALQKQAPIDTSRVLQSVNLGNGVSGDKDNLVSFSVEPGSKVNGIVAYRGEVKGGYFFEANILVNILDSNKKLLKQSNGIAMTDWMTAGPVTFEGNLDFSGLTSGQAYIEIKNDNASGIAKNDKSIYIPVVIE